MKCIEADCNNERMEGKTYCKDCEEFVLSENMERKTINKVICGNAVQELKDIPNESVDLIFVDPPYNLGKDYSIGVKEFLDKEIGELEYNRYDVANAISQLDHTLPETKRFGIDVVAGRILRGK